MDSAGVASLAWTPAIAGQRTVTAEFSGVGTVNGSADSTAVQVADAETPGGGDVGGAGGTDSGAGGLGSLGDISARKQLPRSVALRGVLSGCSTGRTPRFVSIGRSFGRRRCLGPCWNDDFR